MNNNTNSMDGNISNRINSGIQINPKNIKYVREDINYEIDKSDMLIGELNKMSTINNAGILKPEFKLGLDREELLKRTHKDYLTTKKMLDTNAQEYNELSDGDKEALKHLVKAAQRIDKIEMILVKKFMIRHLI